MKNWLLSIFLAMTLQAMIGSLPPVNEPKPGTVPPGTVPVTQSFKVYCPLVGK